MKDLLKAISSFFRDRSKINSNKNLERDPNETSEDEISDEQLKSIHPRLYIPGEGEIIYHYCSAETFLNITKYRTLRFSDIFSMNDFQEMHWGYSIFEQAAGKLLGPIPKSYFDEIDNVIAGSSANLLPLVCCFSQDGDVLSQWRAYGQDGTGYSIGFSAKMLGSLPARSLEVLYNKDQQIEEVSQWLSQIYQVEEEGGFKYDDDFKQFVAFHALDLCALKNPGFREELEVRLAHAVNIDRKANRAKLKNGAGTAWGRAVNDIPIQFRMKSSTPVAYLDLDFSNNNKENPIKKIYLGPKNDSLPSGVKIYLETIGLDNVEVLRSETSYN